MLDQLLGMLTAAAVILCYLTLVECLTAAALLLARFIGHQARHLWDQLPAAPSVPDTDAPGYRIGGGLQRWD